MRYRWNMPSSTTERADRIATRNNLVQVAAQLLSEHGRSAVTTRAVAEAAGVQAPTIYRLFEDKEGLLEAVAEHVLSVYVGTKSITADGADPVSDLKAGWEMNVGFGLANPELFGLLITPGRASRSPAAAAGVEVLRRRVHRVAEAGRLRVSEHRAVQMIQSAGTGAVITLLSVPPESRDPDLTEAMFNALARAILTDVPALDDAGTVAAAVTFRTVVPHLESLSDAERALLSEWLDRTADYPSPAASRTP